MPLTPLQQPRPLSVRIGRIAVRLLLVGMAAWAVLTGYRAYVRHQLAQEIAPVHAFANGISLMLRSGDYFALQEQLSPTRQHRVSIDWLAHFAENTEWNATTGLAWGDWNKTEETRKPSVDILIYAIHPLSGTLQMQALEEAGYRCDLINNETAFLEKLEDVQYRFALVDSTLLPMDDCFMVDIIVQKGIKLYLFGDEGISNCTHTDTYATIPELKKKLKKFEG